jgi:hypothetical protein
MSRQRFLLTVLALMTVLFLGAAAYTFYGNPFPATVATVKTLPIDSVPQAVRLTIYESGMVGVSARELRDLNLPFQNFTTDSLQLTRDGEEIPFFLTGEGDNAMLYFYAEAITATLEAPAVYWLSPQSGLAMRQRDATPVRSTGARTGWQQYHWEENVTFLSQADGTDNWLGPLLFAPASRELELNGILPAGSGELRVRLWSNNESATDPDHHVQLIFNGQTLTDYYWDGIDEVTISQPIPEHLLQEGINLLTLSVPGDTGAAGEAIYIDWVNLSYESRLEANIGQTIFRTAEDNITVSGVAESAMIFDITNPRAPNLLANVVHEEGLVTFAGSQQQEARTYLVLSAGSVISPRIEVVPQWDTLRRADRGADYIAIVASAEGLQEALEPLLAHRRSQGWRVLSVAADQIYDEFAHGRQTPQAIHDFLAYTLNEWEKPAPRFVLLVGDASYDHYDFTGGKNKNLLPTFLVPTQFAGYVASDTWFTIFDTARPLPSLTIGRFPAQTSAQLTAMVHKTIAYETEAAVRWSSRALLVADDEARFDIASDELNEELVNTGYQTQKLYMTENEDIRDAIISAMNQGVGILNYVGHGSVAVWGDEMVLRAEDADILVNGNRLPIFTTFTCLNGYFNHPSTDALAETLLWARNGGVVAAVAPSGRSFTTQQTPLADAFYRYLLSGEASTVGEALMQAKRDAAASPDLIEVIHTFNLLGDPALVFQLPPRQEEG